jgi:hypothetical protein
MITLNPEILSVTVITIIISLACLVPWTLYLVPMVVMYTIRLWNRRRNPQFTIREFEPVSKDVEAAHFWLLGLDFVPLCVSESQPGTGANKTWIYAHGAVATTIAVVEEENDRHIVSFISQFKKVAVATTSGGSSNYETPNLIVNEVASGITPAFQFHQNMVETIQVRAGEPLPLNTIALYRAWAVVFRMTTLNNRFLIGLRQYERWYTLLTVATTGFGLAGLYLIYLERLADWQILLLAVVLVAMIGLHVRLIWHHPAQSQNVEERFKQKNAL